MTVQGGLRMLLPSLDAALLTVIRQRLVKDSSPEPASEGDCRALVPSCSVSTGFIVGHRVATRKK
jgi:hypothetical protein